MQRGVRSGLHGATTTGAPILVWVLTEEPAPGPSPPVLEPPPSAVGPRHDRDGQALFEVVAGAVLLGVVMAFGVYVALRPGAGSIDRVFIDAIGVHKHGVFRRVPLVRRPVVMVVGSVILAVLAVPRDRVRALAVLVGPPVALATSEAVVKPLVGRTLGGALSYPSGTTVAIAALGTAAVLVTPERWRWVTGVVAALYAAWTAVAVVAFQWHLPTDALAGLAYGVGVLLVVDGGAWWLLGHRRHRAEPPGTRSARGR